MANTLLTPQMITKAAVMLWKNSNAFIQNIDTQYSDQFARDGAKIGQTLNVRKPASFTVTDGPALAVQNTNEIYTPLTLSTQRHVDIAFTSAEQALSLDHFVDLILRPAISNLAANVAASVMALLSPTVPNLVGNGLTIGSAGGTLASPTASTFNQARAQLGFRATPPGDLNAIMDYQTDARTANALAGLFNPTGRISQIFDSGEVRGPALGIANWWSDQTTPVVTTGAYTVMPTVNGAGQTGTAITVNAGTGNLNVGDIVSFAGVYSVNPLTFLSTGQPAQFTVTQAYTGGTTLNIYPAITPIALTAGLNTVQYATVTASPANSAAITTALPASTTYRKNLVMHKTAFTLATADLPMYQDGVIACHRESKDGISLRFLQSYDVSADRAVTRIDVLFGCAALMPERACAVADVL